MIEQITAQVEEEMMMAVTFVLPEKLFLLSLFGISSLHSPFSLAFFGVEMFCLLLALNLVSRQSDTRVGERRRQNKVEGSTISAST